MIMDMDGHGLVRKGKDMEPDTKARREKESEDRKKAILEAAWDLFLYNGIAATSMNDIARTCRLAKGTLYLYFSSKDEIAFTLLLRTTENLLAALTAALDPNVSAKRQIERLAIAYYRFFLAQPESFRYMFVVPHEAYSGKVADDIVKRWGDTGKAALGLLDQLLQQGMAKEEFHVADTWSTAIALWSAVTGVIVIPSQKVRRPFLGQVNVEQMVLSTVRLLLKGLKYPSKSPGIK
jgi:AcrR family transcriptional regulator